MSTFALIIILCVTFPIWWIIIRCLRKFLLKVEKKIDSIDVDAMFQD